MDETVNILDLPDEMLLKILNDVPNRYEASLTCQRFYEMVCVIEANKFVMNAVEQKKVNVS